MQQKPKGWSDAELEAIRNLLLIWTRLSPGDISIIQVALKQAGAFAATVEGCAHCHFWENLVRLGWAKREAPPADLPDMIPRPAFFTLTAKGRDLLPSFFAQFKLRPGTFYTPPARARDPAWFDRALESAALTFLESRSYRGFTPVAAARLRQLETGMMALTLSAYADDIRATATVLRDFAAKNAVDAVSGNWLGLMRRIDGNMAWQTTSSLPPPYPSLRELGARLDLGLGRELDEWLRAPTLNLPLLSAWLAEYGPHIDLFVAHAVAWSNRAGQ